MCGICGYYGGQGLSSAHRALEPMTRALAHRGPEEENFWSNSHAGFGHRRLRVIDLETGGQPMTSADSRVTVTFNGEIYNFLAIRRELEKKGRVFGTHSDTESLLQLYEDRGIGFLSELEGMFAFALYDRPKDKLFLAVDRFGKKPLYYTTQSGVFLFASELKSLLQNPLVSKRIDPQALAEYLAFEYVPAPRTILEGISKLEPGTYLEITQKNLQKVKWHEFDFRPLEKPESRWRSEFLENFDSAVEKRLVSDVPLGVFLSGGLDSSAVAASAQRSSGSKKIKTFTIEFDDPSFDESRHARRVSDYLGTEHITERCTAARLAEDHEKILAGLDEPFADASYLPTYFLCRLARRHVTVALSGDGGDELFGGYPTFAAAKLAQALDRLPGFLVRGAGALSRALPTSFDNLSVDFKLKQFFKGMRYRDFARDQVWLGSFSEAEEKEILTPELRALAINPYGILKDLENARVSDAVGRLQAFYFRFYLAGDILVKVDRASMANSLEVRSPLLDDGLVSAMLRLPPGLKRRGFTSKYFFKKAMQGRLPDEIIHRPKKGFGIPIAKWIRSDLKEHFLSTLSRKEIARDGLFDPGAVETLLDEHVSGKKDNRKKLWTLYVFQKWKRNFLA